MISGAVRAPAAAFVPAMVPGDTVPAVALRDQFGAPFALADGTHPTIVSFAYASCPEPAMCPLVTAKFALLQRRLRDSPIRLVEIDLDPARDGTAVLRRSADAAGAVRGRWFFVRSDPARLDALERRFGIVATRLPGGALRHTEAVAILSSAGELRDSIGGSAWSADDVAAQARADAGLSSDPLRRVALALFASVGGVCGGAAAGGITLACGLAILAVLLVALTFLARHLVAHATTDR